MASTYITRTPASSTTTDAWTYSVWVKRAKLEIKSDICCARTDGNNQATFGFDASDQLYFDNYTGGSITVKNITDRKFTDVGAWYHIVLDFDSSTAGARSASDRMKIWINGVRETSFSTETQAGADATTHFCQESGCQIRIGASAASSPAASFEGEMSHTNYVAGVGHPASVFGETDATSGIWKIKTAPSVTYGTNGFNLKMEDRTNLDLDSSPNAYTFATTGTLTATYDNPSDNFATLNPLHESDPSGNYVLSNGNTTLTVTSNDYQRQVGVTIHPAGLKGYFEWKAVTDSNYQQGFQVTSIKLGKTNYDTAATGDIYFLTGDPMRISYSNGGSAATWISGYFPTWAEGDIMGCAFDFTGTNRNVWFHRNGTYGNNGSGVGDPAAGTYPAMTSTQLPVTKEFEITHAANSGTTSVTSFNFGNGYFGTTAISSAGTNASGIGTFEYDVPTGFTALSTKGLDT